MWGKAVTGASGVSPTTTFRVKDIFAKILRQTAEIAGFYAGFSPVLPDSLGKNLQRVVVRCTRHNYLLCFCSLASRFAIRHIFTACSMLVHLFADCKSVVARKSLAARLKEF
jgi:hypothetical protein